jgi:hypothetical protein
MLPVIESELEQDSSTKNDSTKLELRLPAILKKMTEKSQLKKVNNENYNNVKSKKVKTKLLSKTPKVGKMYLGPVTLSTDSKIEEIVAAAHREANNEESLLVSNIFLITILLIYCCY